MIPGPKYYKVVLDRFSPPRTNFYNVLVWRWYWPFWCEVDSTLTDKQAAEYIRSDSVYYDGAE